MNCCGRDEAFPERLRKLRERREMSQMALGELCGLSKNMIAVYERGEAEPTSGIIVQLADFFEVSADYLLGREK